MREVRDIGGGECALGNSHRKAAQNGGEDWRMWTLRDGERDVGNDGETGEDARPALAISESGEDERNGGSTSERSETPVRLRLSLSPLFDSRIHGTRSGVDSR